VFLKKKNLYDFLGHARSVGRDTGVVALLLIKRPNWLETKLSCWKFCNNEVRLQLHASAFFSHLPALHQFVQGKWGFLFACCLLLFARVSLYPQHALFQGVYDLTAVKFFSL